jgi:hypothetical protein
MVCFASRRFADRSSHRESESIQATAEQNTAQLWVTMFFLGAKPPENMTLHGAVCAALRFSCRDRPAAYALHAGVVGDVRA